MSKLHEAKVDELDMLRDIGTDNQLIRRSPFSFFILY